MDKPQIVWHLLIIIPLTLSQTSNFNGKLLGKFNTYHTQIEGQVYVVDDETIFIKGFTYDGKSRDAYFMVGNSLRPSNDGTLVANEEGRTNVLTQYISRDIKLKLPKKITTINWIAIYDLHRLRTLADVSVPEGFEPPESQTIEGFSKTSHGVSSGHVVVFDSKKIVIHQLNYDGSGAEVYFWVGEGAEPTKSGIKIPDEHGYMSSLKAYKDSEVTLELPGNLSVFNIQWLSIWDVEQQQSYGVVFFSKDINIPPALINTIKHESRLPNCEQLHQNLQVSWEIFGPQITIELAGLIGEDDYMAFGISGSSSRSQMMDADVAISYINGHQGITQDYNITEKAPCTKTLEFYRGVCPDKLVGGLDDYQFIMHERKDNLTVMTFRRNLLSADSGDQSYVADDMYLIWAVGHLSNKKEPLFHYLYPKGNVKLNLGRIPPRKTCFDFTVRLQTVFDVKKPPWQPMTIKDPNIIKMNFTLGPSGGSVGYESYAGTPSQQLAWYVNGLLAPEIYVKRNQKYTFYIHGGNDVRSALYNNPIYISNDPDGGHDRLTNQEKRKVRTYAGVNFDRKDSPIPFAAGALCSWENRTLDVRFLDIYPNFFRFRQNLQKRCDAGNPGILEWVPNQTTPNLVYYHSYKHPYMGWKIHVVDYFDTSQGNVPTSSFIDLCLKIVVTIVIIKNIY